jgi:ABC-type lipoprotein export system ATPase subunit/GNAT superfamily N-acetyltransferase
MTLSATIKRSSPIVRSARVMQLEGIFDVSPSDRSELEWRVSLPLDQHEWQVGLIVGPSGCGKTTIAKTLWPEAYTTTLDWHADRAVIDEFPAAMSIKDITMLLSSVGFSSPPSWLRPHSVLSNGEQFRATLARALAEHAGLLVFDEFTSVVDRVVGKIGSLAVAKTVRKRNQKFIAVTCHDDVIDWLDPDWIYLPASDDFQWRLLRRRPAIQLDVARVHSSAWRLFSRHHYLTAELHKGARCFCAFTEGRAVAFHSYLPFVGRHSTHQRAVRGHRSVVLPDYQGCGIGNKLITACASMYSAMDFRVFRNTGHPAEIAGAAHDPNWRMTRAPSRTARDTGAKAHLGSYRASDRFTASFVYVGAKADRALAERVCLTEPV